MAENTINNLSIQVTASAENAARVFDRLASSAGRLRGAASGATGGMREMAQGARDAGTATQQAGTQSGRARPNIRGVGRDAREAGDNAKKGASGLAIFWQSLKRIAFYRFIRSIIREITDAFKTGITNLYHWSDAINGHFAAAMDRLATSSQYLKNSLGAMVAPLIESFIPILDVIIDKIVNVLNFFNMLVAAVSGADTYTVAKKSAAVWDDAASKTSGSAKKAADAIKRTLLGFDEINKLVSQNQSSGSGGSGSGKNTPNYSAMFEEKPLDGIFRKISNVTKNWPDWLKWLLGIGTAVGIGYGLKQLPKLLRNLANALKDLITLKIPNWLSNLFSGSGGGTAGGGGNYNIDVTPQKGDWQVIDDLKKPVPVKVGLAKDGWNNLSAWMGNSVLVRISLAKDGWNNLAAWMGNSVLVRISLGKDGWNNLAAWIGNSIVVYVTLAKAGWNTIAEWMNASTGVLVPVGLRHWGWDNLSDWIGSVVTVRVALKKWKWKDLKTWIGDSHYVNVGLLHWGWQTIEDWIGTAITVSVGLRRYAWTTLGNWTGADSGLDIAIRLIKNGWSTIATFVGTSVTAYVSLRKANWYNLNAWTGNSITAYVYLARGNFSSLQNWVGSQVTVGVLLRLLGFQSGGSISKSGSSSFGTASGGGGSSSGGGAGRGRRAAGGVFSNGIWSSIPQYASGTNNAHGTLFLAGEAGPEIVGNIGGRTEILNKSQLASVMFSSVTNAMGPVVSAMASIANSMNGFDNSISFDELAEYIRQGMTDAISHQNELLREQNQLLQAIIEKPFTAEVTSSSVQRAMNRTNVRAGVTVIPVSSN